MVTDTAHGAVEGDFVTILGRRLGRQCVAAVLNQEYQIDLIVNANSYNITAKDTSGPRSQPASDTGNGGGSTVGAYQINTGTNFM